MRVPAFLHHPVSLLAAVAATIMFVWYVLGRPVEMPRSPLAANEKLDCVSYLPYRAGQSPDDDALVVSAAQIEEDLTQIAALASCVRTHTVAQGLDRVPELARKARLTALVGVALGRDAERNRREVETALALLRTQRPALRGFVVGDEVLSRGDLSVSELGGIIRRVRDASRLPVTYADRWEAWRTASGLLDQITFVTINLDPYDSEFPVSAADTARLLSDMRTRAVTVVGAREIMIADFGWPSAGRMREAARPSPVNQARALHESVAAARANNLRIVLSDAFDQPWRVGTGGTAAAHLGLIDAETRTIKFRWGAAVSNYPLWFYQGLLGVMLALVTFASGYLAARSISAEETISIDWPPVALTALAGGLFLGWAVAEIPYQILTAADWVYSLLLIAVAAVTPPVAAAALVRRTPMPGFSAILDPVGRRLADPLGRILAATLVLALTAAIVTALGLVFEPRTHDIPFAAVSGAAAALLLVSVRNPRGSRGGSAAEWLAAYVLAAAAVYIAFNETFWNWEALWFAAALLALAAACSSVWGARSS